MSDLRHDAAGTPFLTHAGSVAVGLSCSLYRQVNSVADRQNTLEPADPEDRAGSSRFIL